MYLLLTRLYAIFFPLDVLLSLITITGRSSPLTTICRISLIDCDPIPRDFVISNPNFEIFVVATPGTGDIGSTAGLRTVIGIECHDDQN